MTHAELQRLPWKFRISLALETEHATTYDSKIGSRPISKCVHTLKRADGTFGRSYTRYLFEGKVYKSADKALEAINKETSKYRIANNE